MRKSLIRLATAAMLMGASIVPRPAAALPTGCQANGFMTSCEFAAQAIDGFAFFVFIDGGTGTLTNVTTGAVLVSQTSTRGPDVHTHTYLRLTQFHRYKLNMTGGFAVAGHR